jgi:23S rRNA (uracil1939-C5)-methyltransferase
MEFSFSQNRQGERYLGLMLESGRGKVFNLEQCHLVTPWFAQAVSLVRSWWLTTKLHAYHPPSNRGSLQTLGVRQSATNLKQMVILTVSGNPDFAIHQDDVSRFQGLFNPDCSVFLRIKQAIKGRPTEFFEIQLQGSETLQETLSINLQGKSASMDASISPSAFFQPNTEQASRLYEEALKMADLKSDDVVYDLYCGTGTIGLLASRWVRQVVGVELSAEAALDARTNVQNNNVKNMIIVTSSVGDMLKAKDKYPSPTMVFLDPPRSGLEASALQDIIQLSGPRLLYISCNPKTQVRDVHLLMDAGFHIEAIQPIDQFPQTPHIENIVSLKKI